LRFRQFYRVRYLRDAVPNVFHKLNTLRHTQIQNISFCQRIYDGS
jgi:hypothetical protein